jgi:hypothetical protein
MPTKVNLGNHVPNSGTNKTPPVNGGASTATIKWSVGPDGVLYAQSGDQLFARAVGQQQSDGSSLQQQVFAIEGARRPYLTITSVVQQTQRNVSVTIASSLSQLTLTIAGVNRDVSSGTATVSGSLAGKPVNWTGVVDLNTNPFTGNPIPGWPANAFKTELETASVFGALLNQVTASVPPVASTGAPNAGRQADSRGFLGDIGKALLAAGACVGGAVVTGTTGGLALFVVGGLCYDATVGSELIDQYQPPVVPTVPNFQLDPPTETVVEPVKIISMDDPPPPPSPTAQDSSTDPQNNGSGDGSGSDDGSGDGSGSDDGDDGDGGGTGDGGPIGVGTPGHETD